jgi:hypothetical protein
LKQVRIQLEKQLINNRGSFYTYENPAAGIWKAEVTGTTGSFTLSAFGSGIVQFDKLEFVEYSAGAHGGWFPVIYYTSCPVEASGTVSYSRSTVTTIIDYPCYHDCHVPPPTLCPDAPEVTGAHRPTSTATSAPPTHTPARVKSQGKKELSIDGLYFVVAITMMAAGLWDN